MNRSSDEAWEYCLVFPARAGMNRSLSSLRTGHRVPRAGGDEPRTRFEVFPARAGIPVPGVAGVPRAGDEPWSPVKGWKGVPRAGGDEPDGEKFVFPARAGRIAAPCSPRGRG